MRQAVDLAHACRLVNHGQTSGRDIAAPEDKFTRHGIEWFAGPVLGLPWVAGCVAWMECRWLPEPRV